MSKRFRFLVFVLSVASLAGCSSGSGDAAAPFAVTSPTATQRDFSERGYGMLIAPDPKIGVRPDFDACVVVAKEAGFRYVVLETDAEGDFREVAAASSFCEKHGLRFGLFLKLNENLPRDALARLLSACGELSDLRFAPVAGSRPLSSRDYSELRDIVKRTHPDCLVSVAATVDVRSPGAPVRYWPADFRSQTTIPASDAPRLFTTLVGIRYLTTEYIVSAYGKKNGSGFMKSADELESLLLRGFSQGNSVLLRVSPEAGGRIADVDAKRLREVGARLGIQGGKHALPGPVRDRLFGARAISQGPRAVSNPDAAHDDSAGTAWRPGTESGALTFELPFPAAIDRVTLMEAPIPSGRTAGNYAVRDFLVEAVSDKGDRLTLFAGRGIGATRIITLDTPVIVKTLRLIVNDASEPFGIADVRAGLSSDRESRE